MLIISDIVHELYADQSYQKRLLHQVYQHPEHNATRHKIRAKLLLRLLPLGLSITQLAMHGCDKAAGTSLPSLDLRLECEWTAGLRYMPSTQQIVSNQIQDYRAGERLENM